VATDITTPPTTSPALYVVIAGNTLKMGSCNHCVIEEKGRPARAWNPDGDRELDFNRDAFIATMRSLGVNVEIEQEYVCP
jgi:hypothetical protein